MISNKITYLDWKHLDYDNRYNPRRLFSHWIPTALEFFLPYSSYIWIFQHTKNFNKENLVVLISFWWIMTLFFLFLFFVITRKKMIHFKSQMDYISLHKFHNITSIFCNVYLLEMWYNCYYLSHSSTHLKSFVSFFWYECIFNFFYQSNNSNLQNKKWLIE